MKWRLAIACDHAGYPLMAAVLKIAAPACRAVLNLSPEMPDPNDDYPDSAAALAEVIRSGKADRGILICGSGVGAGVAINKFPGVRAALCSDTFSAHQGVEDDDCNVLCLGARVTGPALAGDIVSTFLRARFSGAPRHRRRVGKIRAIEQLFSK